MATQEKEEQVGLLEAEKEEIASEFSDTEEEEAWTRSSESKPRGRPWIRIIVVVLLVAWTLGFIIHAFLVSHKKGVTPASGEAQLRPEDDYILDPNWDFDAPPTTREYHWTIADHELNPDGVYRPMILINGQFPGPLIESNEGDEIVVHIHNRATNATSIHWHGMYQNGTNWMDGTVGITQCPIAPGRDFTYRFKVDGQSGTYYYHSHMSVQHVDGLVGPLVIHARDEEKLQRIPYAQDRVVLVSDHYYDLSTELLAKYLEPGNENEEPVPPSALINGRNTRNCTSLPNRKCDSTQLSDALFDLPSNQNTRLRFINVGAFAEFQIQIDEHELYVSEVDGTDVYPQSIHRLLIAPAQRYSVIIVPPKSTSINKGLYWIRSRMVTHCFAYENPELKEEVRGVLRYSGTSDASATPASIDWKDAIEVECRDLNTSSLHPVVAIRAPEKPDHALYIRSSFQIRDWRLSRGYMNESTYRTNYSSPTLSRFISGYSPKNISKAEDSNSTIPDGINTHLFDLAHELVYQTTHTPVIDVLIQNFDDGTHPFHLHGYKFFVLASGHGYPASNLSSTVDIENPLRRDTVSVEGYAWTLIRFVSDNPGVWPLHCHITWHSEAGLAMIFVSRAEEVVKWDREVPESVMGLCGDEGIGKGFLEEVEYSVDTSGDDG